MTREQGDCNECCPDAAHQNRCRPRGTHSIQSLLFQLVVQCRDEDDQRDLYEELIGRGYRLRVLSL